jgi:hypothetical protein
MMRLGLGGMTIVGLALARTARPRTDALAVQRLAVARCGAYVPPRPVAVPVRG